MNAAATRACLGFSAGAIAALVFHQGLAELFDIFGVGRMAAFRIAPTWPFGIPAVVSLSFWGAMYGVVLALLMPRLRRPLWQAGMALGVVAALVTLFIVLPLKGMPMAHGGALWPIARTVILTLSWGLGTSLLLPLLQPRPLLRPAARPMPDPVPHHASAGA
jgi:hypothetical protein